MAVSMAGCQCLCMQQGSLSMRQGLYSHSSSSHLCFAFGMHGDPDMNTGKHRDLDINTGMHGTQHEYWNAWTQTAIHKAACTTSLQAARAFSAKLQTAHQVFRCTLKVSRSRLLMPSMHFDRSSRRTRSISATLCTSTRHCSPSCKQSCISECLEQVAGGLLRASSVPQTTDVLDLRALLIGLDTCLTRHRYLCISDRHMQIGTQMWYVHKKLFCKLRQGLLILLDGLQPSRSIT